MRRGTFLLLVAAMCAAQQARAASVVAKAEQLLSSDQRMASVTLDEAGDVRLQLPGAPATGWALTATIAGKDIVVTPETLSAYRIYGDTIELPVPAGGEVHLSASGNLANVVLESVVMRPEGKELFPQGGPLERMDGAFRANPANTALVAMANAIVRVRWASPAYPTRWCTGVQVAAGRVLTNRHCLPPEYSLAAPMGETAVQFGNFAGSLADAWELVPAAVTYFPPGAPINKAYRRDMAVLKLNAAPQNPTFRNAVVPLATAVPLNVPLTLITIWSYDDPKGKAVSRGSKCRISVADGGEAYCFGTQTFFHKCEAEEGSSGSPIVETASGKLVGLHYAGIGLEAGNCGLGVDTIRQELAAHPN